MKIVETALLGSGTADFAKLVGDLMRLESRAVVDDIVDSLSDELSLRAQNEPHMVNALCAVKGTPKDAATLGQHLLMEAEKIDRPQLAAEAQGWILLAALKGDHESKLAIEEMITASPRFAPPEGPSPSGAAMRKPREFKTPRSVLEAPVPSEVITEANDVPEPIPPGTGRMIVAGVGDAKSKDGVEIARRFKHVIGREVPYAGQVPAAGVLSKHILGKWPWAADVAQLMEGHAALMRETGSPFVRLPNLLFVGDTGGGKSSIAIEVGGILGIEATLVACGGVADAGGLAATTRGWTTNRPSAPFLAISESNSANPLIVLDELDKGTPARSQNGSVWASALGMLEKQDRYHDSCLMANVDYSAVSFLATANDVSVMPPELRDRFQIVRVPRPRAEDFKIVLEYSLLDEAKALAIHPAMLPVLEDDDRKFLRDMFSEKRHSLRSFRKIVTMMLREKAVSAEKQPRMLN